VRWFLEGRLRLADGRVRLVDESEAAGALIAPRVG